MEDVVFLSSDLDESFIVKVKCERVKGKVFTGLGFGLKRCARSLETDGQEGKKGLFGQGLPNSSMKSRNSSHGINWRENEMGEVESSND